MGNLKPVEARVPASTYRLQFNSDFTFAQGSALTGYLCELGVTDVYSSPVLKARPGSNHGYDVVDHSRLNPEAGTEDEFAAFASRLRALGMGLVMDVVPNHMCIASAENRWWQDLLENGPGSPYARYFDVDWNPPNPKLKDRVLLPILGDQFGRVLERQEIKINYRAGAFHARYYETELPIAPRTGRHVLSLAVSDVRTRLPESHPDVIELESVVTALRNLPPRTETDPARVRERRREMQAVRRRVERLVRESHDVRKGVHVALERANGKPGRGASFDLLEQLLDEQPYRLSYWRVAADEINYRRFFDINELAAVRVEERPVFTAVHEVVFRLIKRGLVTGLRVDHVDGLLNPEKYLHDLQRECAAAAAGRAADGGERPAGEGGGARPDAELAGEGGARPADDGGTGTVEGGAVAVDGGAGEAAEEGAGRGPLPFYVVVEKILGREEELRRAWPAHGTTGYDFAGVLNGVFVDQSGATAFRDLYRDFTGDASDFDDLVYESKRLILRVAMSSELHVLSRRLERVASQHRFSRDFTFNTLHDALAEVIACFPVYRSYVRRRHTSVGPEDRAHILRAVRAAKRRNASLSESIFDFIASVLLLEDAKRLTAHERAERRDFVLRFQQLTSPVTAKGLEDTAFYRYYPLASLNEVGGEPDRFGVSIAEFHRFNGARRESWPHSMSATSTHDSKRGEDVRARIDVLSEIPEEWGRAVGRWREMNRAHKRAGEGGAAAPTAAPDGNEEYLLYQTLVGAWPIEEMDEAGRAEFAGRIVDYMTKALREAKVHTSWINTNDEYERAVAEFVRAVLTPGAGDRFVADFAEFHRGVARAGMLNSLSQTLLKIAAPGVPDFYQGTELWGLTLVDPDNRRPVDYELRRRLLASLGEVDEVAGRAAFAAGLFDRPADGRVKLYVTSRALAHRRARRELFRDGDYRPLDARGWRAENVVAFARRLGERECVAVAARFFTRLDLAEPPSLRLAPGVWGDTSLALGDVSPAARYRDVFTGAEFGVTEDGGGKSLRLADVLSSLPVALLERV